MMPLAETGWLGASGALLAAPLIGFAFGWFLERGGLGSAPKLAGQFYLTDLTVFKVMFSALLTAMLGAFWLDRLGVLQLDLVFLPDTYVVPQALGGVVFGVGFLVAGLCPGTSCVAAAAGRRDGLGVMAGMLIGVWIFNMAFEWIAPTYAATPLGAVRLTDLAGTTPGVGIAAVTVVALAGFIAASHIVRSVLPSGRLHVALAVAAALLAGGAAIVDRGAEAYISAPDLAERIMRDADGQRIFDLRTRRAFEQFHIPGASQVTLEDLAHIPIAPQSSVVLYADARRLVVEGARVLRTRGHRDIRVLREGIYEWLARVHEPRLGVDATQTERSEFERAAALSRFFGGVPLSGVPRDDVPQGYWNGNPRNEALLAAAVGQSVASIRRRGC
jgi:uncharacterized protein